MSEELREMIIDRFLDFYRSDLDSEVVDENNVVLSFPVHYSGFHRIELTITRVNPNLFIISDGAKVTEELKNAGYELTGKLKKRLEKISRSALIRVVDEYLVAESDDASLGSQIQRFVEAAKTVGDAYLVQRTTAPKNSNLINQGE